jgi:dTDP-4-dehydrorhamnose reductase
MYTRVLVTGGQGQLGTQLAHQLAHNQYDVCSVDVDTMDITDPSQVRQTFDQMQPDLVIHCAALTNVDYCAEHPDEALSINGFGTQTIAQACQTNNAALLYISTNEVFDGTRTRPYLEYDPPRPANAYAYSKWVGEQVVRDLVPQHYIVRTSWLFAHGGHNFVHSILGAARSGKHLRVVTNEVGCPTYALDLVAAIGQLIQTGCYGIYHLVNTGNASRYEFARYLLDHTGHAATPIEPITLAEYPRASRPPEYGVLRNFAAARLGITLRSWQDAVAAFVQAEQSV